MKDMVYDIEVYRNLFTCAIGDVETGERYFFEISPRKNDLEEFLNFIQFCQNGGYRWVGFNNYGYDYPVIHYIYSALTPEISRRKLNRLIYTESKYIIDTDWDDRFSNIVWDKQQVVPQLDLYKVHHFDNMARATSLKMLEFNMKMTSIRDLPYDPDYPIKRASQMSEICEYNWHDFDATLRFYHISKPLLDFRKQLTETYKRNFMNHNDTKIGKDYFIMELERKLGDEICYKKVGGKRVIQQTVRSSINLGDVIFDNVKFDRPEFQAVHRWLTRQNISTAKGVFTEIPMAELGDLREHANLKLRKGNVKNLNCVVDGFQFDFGSGGIHGSVDGQSFESDEEWMVWDWDVTSYYPSLAIANKIFPEHLGVEFCSIYSDMKDQRVGYAKGTPENAMLKLALNGVYGDSGNPYSPFYDMKYLFSVTINGQLLLCMLWEWLYRDVPEIKIIQINTDGVTIYVKRKYAHLVREICTRWENETGLDLEDIEYSKMYVRDVNNYIACYDGGVKRKGSYEYNVEWHKNHSSKVIAKAAEAKLVYGNDVREFIENHDDDYDFFRRTKVRRNSQLEIVDDLFGDADVEKLQRVTRYYVSKDGGELFKIMPPLPKAPDKERRTAVDKGFLVTACNDTIEIDRENLNYEFYIQEALKLTEMF